MARRRHTPEQVVRKLREADRLLGEGIELPEVIKQLEVSEQTYYNHRRPHRAHGLKIPAAFKTDWETTHEAARAGIELHSPSGLAPLDAGEIPTVAAPINHQLSQQVDR